MRSRTVAFAATKASGSAEIVVGVESSPRTMRAVENLSEAAAGDVAGGVAVGLRCGLGVCRLREAERDGTCHGDRHGCRRRQRFALPSGAERGLFKMASMRVFRCPRLAPLAETTGAPRDRRHALRMACA